MEREVDRIEEETRRHIHYMLISLSVFVVSSILLWLYWGLSTEKQMSYDIFLLMLVFLSSFVFVIFMGIVDCHLHPESSIKRRIRWSFATLISFVSIPIFSHLNIDSLTILSAVSFFFIVVSFVTMEGECAYLRNRAIRKDTGQISQRQLKFMISFGASFYFAGMVPYMYRFGVLPATVAVIAAILSTYFALRNRENTFNIEEFKIRKKRTNNPAIISVLIFYMIFLYFIYHVFPEPCIMSYFLTFLFILMFGAMIENKKGIVWGYISLLSTFTGLVIWVFLLFIKEYLRDGVIDELEFLILTLGLGFVVVFIIHICDVLSTFRKNSP